jgi:hypothetical protein
VACLGIHRKRLKVVKEQKVAVNRQQFEAHDCFYKPGTLSAAFAWFQQAMEVRVVKF